MGRAGAGWVAEVTTLDDVGAALALALIEDEWKVSASPGCPAKALRVEKGDFFITLSIDFVEGLSVDVGTERAVAEMIKLASRAHARHEAEKSLR